MEKLSWISLCASKRSKIALVDILQILSYAEVADTVKACWQETLAGEVAKFKSWLQNFVEEKTRQLSDNFSW